MMLPLTQIKLAAVVAAIMAAAWFGRHYTVLSYEAQIAEQNREVAELQTQLERKSAQVITRYVDRVRDVQAEAQTIIKEVPVYVTQAADAQCVIPVGFVRVHDTAANGVSDAPGAAYAAPSGVALSAVAATVAANYGACRETAEQLKALQDWARATHGQEAQKN